MSLAGCCLCDLLVDPCTYLMQHMVAISFFSLVFTYFKYGAYGYKVPPTDYLPLKFSLLQIALHLSLNCLKIVKRLQVAEHTGLLISLKKSLVLV